jgi:propionyl-CoA carboxylase alpha chain
MQQVRYTYRGEQVMTGYLGRRDGSFGYDVNGSGGEARIIEPTGEQIEIEIDGVRRTFSVTTDGLNHWVQSTAGEIALVETPRSPAPVQERAAGGYAAPMPGKVVAVYAEPGQSVSAGQLVIVLEAMKMEHRITCSEAGTVKEVHVRAGDQVEAGQTMLVIDAGGRE